MNSDVNIEHFAESVRAYCLWAEGAPAPPEQEARTALRHLAGLLAGVLELPKLYGDEEAPDIDRECYDKVFVRFRALPFDNYSKVFDSRPVPPEEPTVSSLADDLADIWWDLKPGLMLFDVGFVPAAVWWWHDHFDYHWGYHAAGAIYALHCWLYMQADT